MHYSKYGLKKRIISLLNKLPYIRRLYKENKYLQENNFFPPGHYYSPIISLQYVKENEDKIWGNDFNSIAGIDLRPAEQLNLLEELAVFYNEIPFTAAKQPETRYFFENDFYSYTDGIILYSMMRKFMPKRIIEIGSGFSSALMLDTNELFFDNKINFLFIEPNAERLQSLLKPSDILNTQIIRTDVQNISINKFKELEANDILFVDSSHVAKTGSDVNHILFNILPQLQQGVLVHFHDIFYPFEYVKEWIFKGISWNESYFIRAFLMYNDQFKIKLFSHYLHLLYKNNFKNMPLCYKNHGGNLWTQKSSG